jgi:hypothetical protein
MSAEEEYETWDQEEEARPLFARARVLSVSKFAGWSPQMTVGSRSKYRKATFLLLTRRNPDSVVNHSPRRRMTRRTYKHPGNQGCIVGSAS